MTAGVFLLGALLAAVMAGLCVLLHYEGLSFLGRVAAHPQGHWLRRRPRMVVVVMGVIGLHVLEIWLYGGLYMLLDVAGVEGPLHVLAENLGHDWFDPIYFSGVVYTSLGFGDMIPVGIYRMLSVSETLLGLVLIAWSASFTYLLMERLWGRP